MDVNLRAQLAQLSSHLPIRRPRLPQPESISLSVVGSELLRGPLSGTVAQGQFGTGKLFPFLGCAIVQPRTRARIWLYEGDKATISTGTIAITSSGQSRLGITSPDQRISVELPEQFAVRARTPPAMDLPSGASIHVSPTIFKKFRRRHQSAAYALLTSSKGVVAPVRLNKRKVEDGYILAPMFVRILCDITEGSIVQLSTFPKLAMPQYRARLVARVFRRPPPEAWKKNIGALLGLMLIGVRLIDFTLELLLRLTLRSQPLAFRVLQANPGDDNLIDTIRLHPSAFAALALNPGGQVILNWAGHRMTARVLEDPAPIDTPAAASPHVLGSAGLHLDVPGILPDGFPAYLVVKMPAFIRQSLNIPPSTIIELRRRIRPAVVSQLNQLTIPVAGLILAAAAFPAIRGWPLIAGGVAALVLGLAPLRMPRTPRGRWP
jgi:hypothetical protein